jgi:hypothetical protein
MKSKKFFEQCKRLGAHVEVCDHNGTVLHHIFTPSLVIAQNESGTRKSGVGFGVAVVSVRKGKVKPTLGQTVAEILFALRLAHRMVSEHTLAVEHSLATKAAGEQR